MVLGALGTSLLTAAPAGAHEDLVSSTPAEGEVLEAVPAVVELTFTADLLDISTLVVVTGPDGEPVEVPSTVDGAVVSAPFPEDPADGAYTVAWRVVSGDGHPIQGSFGFLLAVAGPGTATATAPSGAAPGADSPAADPSDAPTPAGATAQAREADRSSADATSGRGALFLAIAGVLLAGATAATLIHRRRAA